MKSFHAAAARSSTRLRHLEVLTRWGRLVSSTSTPSAPDSPTPSSSKTTDDTIAVDGVSKDKQSTLAAQCIQPRPIFPWRSSPDHLPRLIKPVKPNHVNISHDATEDEINKANAILDEYYESDYFAKGGHLGPGWASPTQPWFRGALYANSMHLLGMSWPYIIMPWTRQDWEHDMEWAFCNAFSNGVNGMVHDTYMIKQKDKEKDSQTEDDDIFDVNLDLTLDPVKLEDKGDILNKGANSNKNPEISKEDEQFSMLERNLRHLYQSAKNHSHPAKVNIILRTIPQSARIESMFPVFGLSRTLVENHPNIRHTYKNLMKRLREKQKVEGKTLNPIQIGSFVMEGLLEILERSATLSGDGKAVITIVAQVSINCKEIFCVRDVESGEIIQGYEDGQPRDVTHLVRFEMVVKEKLSDAESISDLMEGDWDMELGRWQITDWDDLLDGNVFFT